jgi:hypothetical protein
MGSRGDNWREKAACLITGVLKYGKPRQNRQSSDRNDGALHCQLVERGNMSL